MAMTFDERHKLRIRIEALESELKQLRQLESNDIDAQEGGFHKEIERLVKENRRIDATNLYRAKTGYSLREAYDYVQSL